MPSIILFNKPFHVLSQFTSDENKQTLANFIPQPDIYPAGRLDYDSEGLLLLTDDGALQHLISSPKQKMPKTYWVQVEGDIQDTALQELRDGITLKDGKTKPAQAKRLNHVSLWPRIPPIRERKQIPTSWIELTISEGKNRQVRRMTAAVGFPTLRLVRVKIGPYSIKDLPLGEYQSVELDPALAKKLAQFKQHKKPPSKKAVNAKTAQSRPSKKRVISKKQTLKHKKK